MQKIAEQTYDDLLDLLSRPLAGGAGRLADALREVERLHAAGQIADWQLQNAREAYARTGGSKAGAAARWVVDKASEKVKEKAKDTLHAAAGQVRERTSAAVSSYTRQDPVRAMLIAAVTGAVLMAWLSSTVRSGARAVRRRVGRG